MTVKVTLSCLVKSGQIETLIPFLQKNLPNVRSFDGCLYVGIYFDKANDEMLIEEEWLSVEKHQAYMSYIEQNGVLGELAAFFESPPTVKYFTKEDI